MEVLREYTVLRSNLQSFSQAKSVAVFVAHDRLFFLFHEIVLRVEVVKRLFSR